MAFRRTSGHEEYTVMAYRLYCIPPVFQSLINNMPRNMLGKFIIDHIDNILKNFPSLESHVHVKKVLSYL